MHGARAQKYQQNEEEGDVTRGPKEREIEEEGEDPVVVRGI